MSYAADPLGCLAAAAAGTERGRGSRGRGRTRAGMRDLGLRLSAAELLARGVDAAFLVPAPCVDGTPPAAELKESRKSGGVAFVSAESRSNEAVGSHGQVAGNRQAVGIPARQLDSSPAWSPAEMHAEYGRGYAMMAAMGYTGGGRVPLMSVKRQDRVGLQDDEALVVDRNVAVAKKRRRLTDVQRASASTTVHGQPVPKSDAALYGKGLSSSSSSRNTSDEEESDAQPASVQDNRLRRAIVAEIQRNGRQVPLAELVQQPRIHRGLVACFGEGLARQDGGGHLEECAGRFIRHHLPRYHIRRSAAPGWRKLSGSNTAASWQQALRHELVVTLKKRMLPGKGSGENSNWHASSSSSEEAVPVDSESPERQPPGQLGNSPSSKSECRCHSCGRAFSQWASLREHVLERLLAHTTRDPTNLHAQFDAEHHDRDSIRAAAVAVTSGGAQEDCGESNCQSVTTLASTWHCPIRGCRCGTFSDFLVMLEHAAEAPTRRAEHRRLLALVAELLLREPPPRLHKMEQLPTGKVPWCSKGLSRLFTHCLSPPEMKGTTADEYQQLEEEVLGPGEEDMFGPAEGVQCTADAAAGVFGDIGTGKTTFV